jgi:hypothetical protein
MENQQEKELTHEELIQKKEEMKAFYDESTPYLESQAKYEKLLTEIEEARFKRASYQYQFAMMMEQTQPQAGDESDEADDFPIPPPVKGTTEGEEKRKLKKG